MSPLPNEVDPTEVDLIKKKEDHQLEHILVTETITNTCNDLLVLVDKKHALPSHYTPPDLTSLKDHGIPVNAEVITARQVIMEGLKQLFADSTKAGLDLVIVSAYRSYEVQDILYTSYVQNYGQAEADTFSARPGHSQHQLGTSLDFSKV